MVYSTDGTILLSSDAYDLKIWDALSGTIKFNLKPHGHFVGCSISPDGKFAAFSDSAKPGVVFLHDVERNESAGEMTAPNYDMDIAMHFSFSGDGGHLVVSGGWYSGVVFLWNMTTRQLVRRIPGQGSGLVISAQLSSDGRIFVTLARHNADDIWLQLWDVESGRMLYEFSPMVMSGEASMFLTGCGTSLRVTVVNLDGGISTWRLGEQGPSCIFKGHVGIISQAPLCCVYFGSSETSEDLFVLATTEGEIIFYRPEYENRDALEIRHFTGDSERAVALAFTSDGLQMASGDKGGKIRLWDTRKALGKTNNGNGKERTRVMIDSATFVPGSENLIVVWYCNKRKSWKSEKSTIIWDSDEGIANILQCASDAVYDAPIRRLEMRGDGKLALSFYNHSWDFRVDYWDRAERLYRVNYLDPQSLGSTLPDVFEPVKDVRFNLDRSAAALWDGKASIKVLDLTRKRAVVEVKVASDPYVIDINHIALSTDGLLLACATKRGGHKFDVQVWDLVEQNRRHAVELCTGEKPERVKSLDFSPDGDFLLLIGTRYNDIIYSARMIDVRTGEERGHILPRNPALLAAKFSPDSMAILFQGDHRIALYKLKESCGPLTNLYVKYPIRVIWSSFSPDSQLLAVSLRSRTWVPGERDCIVDIWNVSTASRIWRKAFTADIATCDIFPKIRFSKTGDRLESIRGRLPWSRTTTGMDPSPHTGLGMTQSDLWDCIYIGKEWIIQGNDKKLIRLPSKFQCNKKTKAAKKNGRVFLSSELGELMSFKIHPEKTPMAKEKMGTQKEARISSSDTFHQCRQPEFEVGYLTYLGR